MKTFDTEAIPADLRDAWRKREAASVSYLAGVRCQSRAQAVLWHLGDRRLAVWRKRGRLHWASSKAAMPWRELMRMPSRPLTSWPQLELLVLGLVPRREDSDGEVDACTRIMGGGL